MALAAPQEPVSFQVIVNAFVSQYYHILHHSPSLAHKFYQDVSKIGRPEDDGSMSITTTLEAINTKLVSLNYNEFRAEIASVDAQESYNSGIHVLVTGSLTGKDNTARNFAQSFFLAPQERGGYFVLNDLFLYVKSAKSLAENKDSTVDMEEAISTLEQVEKKKKKKKKNKNNQLALKQIKASPVEKHHITEETTVLAVESNGEEVNALPTNGEQEVVLKLKDLLTEKPSTSASLLSGSEFQEDEWTPIIPRRKVPLQMEARGPPSEEQLAYGRALRETANQHWNSMKSYNDMASTTCTNEEWEDAIMQVHTCD